ncbi:MAG: bifunctional UDP-N-acetylmuramoyl-tripeptide:D-alanyl-D-alanine ligase/alanine racemase [Bacteroidaceae bacterium]|nr:bifunctional UDP-N-acetylmuramoyl-tripeptide:D-alanyl-D-alanine ligase/alanine racemase [Bacteroidaceae bacterium]
MEYSIKDITALLACNDVPFEELNISLLLTDSRSIKSPSNTLFFAIKSKTNDGHKFIEELYKKGVRNFVVEQELPIFSTFKGVNIIKVKNSVKALQKIASAHRKRFKVPVIGITGSNGKTIVKEWLNQLLQPNFFITRSPRSYNSQIGVPLSVWELEQRTTLAIFEAGISQAGEMETLSEVISPSIGIFTCIGDAHQEGFKSVNEKLNEKLKLFKDSKTIIYNASNSNIKEAIESLYADRELIGWSDSNTSAPLYVKEISKSDNVALVTYIYNGKEESFKIPFIEDGSIENAIHTLCAMLFCFNITPQEAAKRLLNIEPVAMRLEVKEGKNNCTIINDTYNSDINSLEIALDFLSRRSILDGGQRRLILSDILQSSSNEVELYTIIAKLLTEKGVDKFVGIGERLTENKRLFPEGSTFYRSTAEFLSSGMADHFNNELILVKGARKFNFDEITDNLSLKQHETILEVNLDAIRHNYNYYKQKLLPATKVICMVKAFGYGAGSYELTKTLQDAGCSYVAVAVADEGAELRKAGITMPIMVMNPEMGTFDTLFKYNLEPEVYNFRLLEALTKSASSQGITDFPIHIKIDSGMHRLGFTIQDMPKLIKNLTINKELTPCSVFSHLAGSDDDSLDYYTEMQIETFSRCAESLQMGIGKPIFRHILNTAGISRYTQYQFEGVRLGIGLYGVAPHPSVKGLKSVSALKTTILQIKELTSAETVGYGRRGVLNKKSRIAAVPIGYADGLNRHLGNGGGAMWVNGKLAPIVGNVCMDVTMIDVTDIECAEGDTVEVFGENIKVEDIAQKLGTIPYEVLTSVSARVKRVYFKE